MTTLPPLPALPPPDRTMWQHGRQIDHYTAAQMRAYANFALDALGQHGTKDYIPCAWQAVGGSIWGHKTCADDRALYDQDALDSAVSAALERRKGYALGTVSGDAASRLAAAPIAIMDTRDALGLCAPTEDDFPALYALQGHRVALVDLGTT